MKGDLVVLLFLILKPYLSFGNLYIDSYLNSQFLEKVEGQDPRAESFAVPKLLVAVPTSLHIDHPQQAKLSSNP